MGATVGPRRASLALPVFNEGPRIRATLIELYEHLRENVSRYEWEIVVVDDGSHDDSLAAVVEAGEQLGLPLRVLAHEGNHGLGSALSSIFREARGDVIVTVDADLTYSVDHVARLVEALESTGAAVVVASPYAPGGTTRSVPRGLEVRSRLANRYLAAMTGNRVATLTGIVRAFDGEFARSLPPLRGGANANIAVLHEAWRQRLDVVEIPAELNWTGQEYRRARHAMISMKSVRESLSVLSQGAHLRHVTRRSPAVLPVQRAMPAATLMDDSPSAPVIDLRDPSSRGARRSLLVDSDDAAAVLSDQPEPPRHAERHDA